MTSILCVLVLHTATALITHYVPSPALLQEGVNYCSLFGVGFGLHFVYSLSSSSGSRSSDWILQAAFRNSQIMDVSLFTEAVKSINSDIELNQLVMGCSEPSFPRLVRDVLPLLLQDDGNTVLITRSLAIPSLLYFNVSLSEFKIEILEQSRFCPYLVPKRQVESQYSSSFVFVIRTDEVLSEKEDLIRSVDWQGLCFAARHWLVRKDVLELWNFPGTNAVSIFRFMLPPDVRVPVMKYLFGFARLDQIGFPSQRKDGLFEVIPRPDLRHVLLRVDASEINIISELSKVGQSVLIDYRHYVSCSEGVEIYTLIRETEFMQAAILLRDCKSTLERLGFISSSATFAFKEFVALHASALVDGDYENAHEMLFDSAIEMIRELSPRMLGNSNGLGLLQSQAFLRRVAFYLHRTKYPVTSTDHVLTRGIRESWNLIQSIGTHTMESFLEEDRYWRKLKFRLLSHLSRENFGSRDRSFVLAYFEDVRNEIVRKTLSVS